MLTIEHVSKSFGGVHAVRDCSVRVAPRTITALIGPNGAGKTTLFNMVGGFVSVDAGSITFAGHTITYYPAWQRSRLGLARTFQLSRVFKNLTIREHLLLAIRQDDDRFWQSILRHADPYAHTERMEKTLAFVGLKKPLDTPIIALSYGEQKLFDLARALLKPHTFLMLDEPVAGVNPVLREQLKNIMRDLKQRGETILLIEHDMDFVRSVADWVIVMDQGTVLAKGKPDEVLQQKEVLAAYLGV